MIWINSVMTALYTTIASDDTIVNSGINVDLNGLYNLDPNSTPWIGIYNGKINGEAHTINSTLPWLTTFSPVVYVQIDKFDYDGKKSTDFLDKTITVAMTAINCNRTLGNIVDNMTAYTIDNFEMEINNDKTILAVEISLNYEARS